MRKFFLTLVLPLCFLAQLCACNGVEDPQPDNTLILDFSALLAQMQDGAEVAGIEAVEREGNTVGYIVTFADGNSVTLLNQTADGAQGSEVKGLSEDSQNYWFDLRDGKSISLPKVAGSEPFKVELSGDEVELTDGGTLQASYKVSGAKGLEITAMAGEGWSAEISKSSEKEGTIKVSAPNPITTDKVLVSFKDEKGRQVVRALRLTTKSAVRRGNITTYTFAGLNYISIDPDTVDYATALRRYQEVVDAGVQIMEASAINWWLGYDWSEDALYCLDLAEKVGLKLSLDVNRLVGNTAALQHFVSVVKDHPALWGYKVMDEPKASQYADILSYKRAIHAIDPDHPCYVNLRPDGGTFGDVGSYHTKDYQEYVDRYVAETEPEFISFDEYPCFPDWVLEKCWYTEIATLAKAAKENNLDLWGFAATCRFSDGFGLRIKPNLPALRLQHYTNLIYGAQGLEYFVWGALYQVNNLEINTEFDAWPTDPNGDINTADETYESIKALNKEVQARAFVFDGCDVKWVAFLNSVPDRCDAFDDTKLPEEIMSVTTENDLIISLSENDGGQSEYFFVKSRTHVKTCKAHLRFRHPVQTVERDGSLKTYNAGDYDFTIDKGDILIIKTK